MRAITVTLDEEIDEYLREQLDHGDNRSQLVRNALRDYLDIEPEADRDE